VLCEKRKHVEKTFRLLSMIGMKSAQGFTVTLVELAETRFPEPHAWEAGKSKLYAQSR